MRFWRIGFNKAFASIMLAVFVLAGCGGSSSGGDETASKKQTPSDNGSQAEDPVIISDDAVALEDPQLVEQLSDISKDGVTLKFSGAPKEVTDLEPGKIISLPPTNLAPTGLLRKVIAVNDASGETILETEKASLTDVIEQGSFEASGTLQAPSASVQSASFNSTYTPGITVLHQSEGVILQPTKGEIGALAIDSPDTLPFVLGLEDVVIYDEDGDFLTKNDQVVASGKIGFSIDYDIEGDIDFFKLQNLNFTATATEISEISLNSAKSASFDKSTTIWSARLTSIKILVGGWPLWITPELDVVVSANGQVNATVSTGATGKITATSGINYSRDRATPWMPIAEKSSDFELMPLEVNADASATVSAGPAINFLIYDLVGPRANLEGYLMLTANILDDPWWRIYGGIRAGAGVTLEILDRTIADVMYPDIVDYQIEIAKAEAGITPLPDVPLNLSVAQDSTSAVLNWDDAEGPASYRVYFKTSPNVIPGTTGVTNINVSDSSFVHTDRMPGETYYYRVTAVNAAGESDTSSEVALTIQSGTNDDNPADNGNRVFDGSVEFIPAEFGHVRGTCELTRDSSGYFASVLDQSSSWWCAQVSPSFEPVTSNSDFTIEFDFNPIRPDWGHYPSVTFFNASEGNLREQYDTAVANQESLYFSISWSDSVYKKFRIRDGINQYFSETIPASDERYRVKLSYNSANQTIDWLILREDGSIFLDKKGLAWKFDGSFNNLLIGELGSGPIYGGNAQIRVDNIIMTQTTN